MSKLLAAFFVCILSIGWHSPIKAQQANQLFEHYSESLLQVRLIEKSSGGKSSIGTGFIISQDGKIATNYHVVSGFVQSPEKYRLEYLLLNGQKGLLDILSVDVVNDLAIVSSTDIQIKPEQVFHVAQNVPSQGDQVFALGNPHDLGMIVVPGTYNGLKKHSFYQRIHFTGSINPGMSGGPAVNESGDIIGINVATAGNQIGFLVPAKKLSILMSNVDTTTVDSNLKLQIREQLITNQNQLLSTLINQPWQKMDLGPVNVPGEVAPFIRCWGNSNSDKKDKQVDSTVAKCNLTERIFISNSLETGSIEMEYEWLTSDKLNPYRFYNLYERRIAFVSAGNKAGKEDVTEFECEHDLVQTESANQLKAVMCARAYKEYEGIYDIVYIAATTNKDQEGIISHFTLSGVQQESALAFTNKFMEAITWK